MIAHLTWVSKKAPASPWVTQFLGIYNSLHLKNSSSAFPDPRESWEPTHHFLPQETVIWKSPVLTLPFWCTLLYFSLAITGSSCYMCTFYHVYQASDLQTRASLPTTGKHSAISGDIRSCCAFGWGATGWEHLEAGDRKMAKPAARHRDSQ